MKNSSRFGGSSSISGKLAGIAMLALIGLVIGYLVKGESDKLKEQNAKLVAELDEVEQRWVKLRREQGELAYLEQKIGELKEQTLSARDEAAILQRQIEVKKSSIPLLQQKMKKIYQRYRDHVRESAKGEKHAQIQSQQGKIYFDVEIIEVAPDGISIRHRDGGARLGFGKMPEAWIKRFMYAAAGEAKVKRK